MKVKRHVQSFLQPYGKISIEIKSRNGVVKRRDEFPMHSFNYSLWRMMNACFAQTSFSLPALFSGSVTIHPTSTMLTNRTTALAGAEELNGIVLGTDNTAMLISNVRLWSVIEHGLGSGQLYRSDMSHSVQSTGCTFTRSFDNTSGSTINVEELAIYVRSGTGEATSENIFMLCRDVLGTTVPVENGETASVTYQIFFLTGNRNLQIIWQNFWGTSVSATPTRYLVDGTTANLHLRQFDCRANVGQQRGIFLGTGDTAVDINDIALVDEIPHGTGPGELLYGDGTVGGLVESPSDGTSAFDVSRLVTNNSGADITVREMALFANTSTTTANTRFLLDRYVLSAPITILNGESRIPRWMFRYSI